MECFEPWKEICLLAHSWSPKSVCSPPLSNPSSRNVESWTQTAFRSSLQLTFLEPPLQIFCLLLLTFFLGAFWTSWVSSWPFGFSYCLSLAFVFSCAFSLKDDRANPRIFDCEHLTLDGPAGGLSLEQPHSCRDGQQQWSRWDRTVRWKKSWWIDDLLVLCD